MRFSPVVSTAAIALALVGLASTAVSAKAIIGVDLGSIYMKVALVQRGAPLEIVTNLHSKRKTEQMILFDQGSRFYGADASSLLARKPTKTPSAFSVMLGRDEQHPAVQVISRRHFPLPPQFNETRNGLNVLVDKKDSYTPEELAAMVLGHAKEITTAYGAEKGNAYGVIQDCVLTVPSFATQAERQAMLDMAALADLNVLSLIDENTAAALHFGMDKQYSDPQLILFYNLGASSLQVSLVKFHTYEVSESKYSKKTKTVGSLEVLAKTWDETLGGLEFDHRIVEYLADLFNEQWRKARNHDKDVRSIPRAMVKLRLQANKVKHVLSANTEIPVYMDSLHDDLPLSVTMTRTKLEEICADLFERAIVPVNDILKRANITIDEVSAIEMIGGGMRVPKVQSELSDALGGKTLGMHINSDESMALGAAFFGANISTAFRVRQVGFTDVSPFPVAISLKDLPVEEKKGFFGGSAKNEDADEEEWSKQATMFKVLSKMGTKKTIAFSHDRDVHCALDYAECDQLPEGTEPELQRYNITGIAEFAKEMSEKGLGKPKVSLQFELSQSGITNLVKAEAAVEETYIAEEEVEVDDDDETTENATDSSSGKAEAKTDAKEETKEEESTEEEKSDKDEPADEKGEAKANATESDGSNEAKKDKPKKKPKKTIKVEKEKKRTLKRTLKVDTYYVGKVQPYSEELMAESKAKMLLLEMLDKERIQLEEARNKVESYVYSIKNKLIDDEENVNKVSTEEQREELRKLAEETEDWLFEDSDLATTEAKYLELSTPAEKVWFRVKEMTDRPTSVLALQEKLIKVEELMKKWESTMPQVTDDEKVDVASKIEDVRKWIAEKEAEQEAKQPHEEPAFSSADVPLQTKSLEKLVTKLSKKPKPKPPKKDKDADKNKTAADEGTNETMSDEPEDQSQESASGADNDPKEEYPEGESPKEESPEGESPKKESATSAEETDDEL